MEYRANRDAASLAEHVRMAQVVLPCRDLATTLAFFTDRLGFKVNLIFPADSPQTAVVSGHGLTLRLETGTPAAPMTLRLLCDLAALPAGTPHTLSAPDGTRIELAEARLPLEVPEGTREFVLTRMSEGWGVGRAGMQYRDLIPSRLGGRFIASHIRIPVGGPVPDYVHFHRIRFQMIYCKAGWARLVYEDQGAPFLFHAGDCVLQPPEIRHRVLEASDGLEVIEIGCPALHETFADHAMTLPTPHLLPSAILAASASCGTSRRKPSGCHGARRVSRCATPASAMRPMASPARAWCGRESARRRRSARMAGSSCSSSCSAAR
jgi:catechol 2,3-dioxygenase-like lactoylglutathione lyase family enzyme